MVAFCELLLITNVVPLLLGIINFKDIMSIIEHIINIFEPFFMGIVIAFIFNQPCMFIEKKLNKRFLKSKNKFFKRVLSMLFCYGIFFVLIIIMTGWLIPELINSTKDILKNFEGYANNMQSMVNQITDYIGLQKIYLQPLFNWTFTYADKIASSITEILVHIINLTATGMIMIARLLFSIVFSIYFLFGKEKLLNQGKKIFSTYLSERLFDKLSYVYKIVINIFGNYLIGQTIEALILTIICFLGMIICGFSYPILISALVGLTSLVPMVGPYIGGLIGFRILVMINPIKAIWFIVFLILLQQFEGDIIYPRIVGKKVGLPGMLVLLSISVGAGVAGLVGILLAVPVVSVFYTLLKSDMDSKCVKSRNEENISMSRKL